MRRRAWLLVGLLLCLSGCGRKTAPSPKPTAPPQRPPAKVAKAAVAPKPSATAPAKPPESEFKPITAKVKPYKVSASLKEVVNIGRFQGTAEQKRLLAQNLFVVTPTDEQQLFFIYENNDYGNIPSFVTTDLVLQLYHVFYDFTLRRVEAEKLTPLLRQLAQGMFDQSVATWKELNEPKLKVAALKNTAYFSVAAQLLGLKPDLPKEASQAVKTELALIEKHEGMALGSVFPYKIDYSQFVPRGHYTRTESLKRFFKTMMWYGLAPFAFYKQIDRGDGSARTERSDETVRMGLLFVRDLYRAKLQDTWERIYEPTAFYVALADDLTPAEYKRLADEVFGKDAPVDAFADSARLDAFVQRGKKLRLPLIRPRVLHVVGLLLPFPDTETCQLRFMGQRHIPDSEITQRLTKPWLPPRPPFGRFFPSGMDVMAVLGSRRAEWLLDVGFPDLFDTKRWPEYRPERQKLAAEFAKLNEKQWTRNMYWGWLWTLQSLLRPMADGYPSFMRNDPWQDKSLSTALASWAELRHDTILYGKQSLTAIECGGEEEEPPRPKGYVEPNVDFYQRLQILTRLSKDGLVRRRLLSSQLKEKFEAFEDLLVFLLRVSEQELANEKLTREEYEQIRIIGAEVERLTLSVMEGQASRWHEITSPTDRDMAVIADVHTGGVAPDLQALEEAVGHANEILVIVPVEGKLQLCRGAVFSYREFLHPYQDRLTDEKWQQMLKSGKAAKPPLWTKTFLAPKPKGERESMKVVVYSTGC